MLNTTGRTLTGFVEFINSCKSVRNEEVNCREQSDVDRHIAKIDKLLNRVSEWSGWFPSKDDMQNIVDTLNYERKYTLNKAREYRKEAKHAVA